MNPVVELIAYNGDAAQKQDLVEQVVLHRKADEIAQGAYVRKNGKTTYCAVGCVMHDRNGNHAGYEKYGIPALLAHLEDGIFEALPSNQAKFWPERFMGAIPVGADLSSVWPRFAAWMMVDEKWGVINTTDKEDVKDVCRKVADAYVRIAEGESLSSLEVKEITDAARAAWDAWAAWAAFVEASADKLIELLEGAPVAEKAAA